MRPERGDILDNFTPDMAQFIADLLKTMPGARLVVRRSRRRPAALLPHHEIRGDKMTVEAGAVLVAYQQANALNAIMREGMGYEWPQPIAEWTWQSPAQLGRKNGRKRKRERVSHMSMMTPLGPMNIIADRRCRDDEIHFTGRDGARVVNIQPPATHAAVAEALAASGETRVTHAASAIVSPRTWATLSRNAAALRMYTD